MDVSEEIPPFLSIPFDWYILEKWNASSSESKRDQHIRLGIEFARLGHAGRRPYVIPAKKWIYNRSMQTPRPVEEVPHDLLSDQERRGHKHPDTVWIRTDYSKGTDERHAELIKGFDDDISIPLGDLDNLLDDANRYDFGESVNPSTYFAFVPRLLIPETPHYSNKDYSYDNRELQEHLFPSILSGKHRLSNGQTFFFVADAEAMRTGFLLWIQPDQYGRPLRSNRVQPWSIGDLVNMSHIPFEELCGTDEDGVIAWFGGNHDEQNLGPWTPPT